jgi:hypothetical protein
MTCRDVRRRLPAHLDGDLSAAEARALSAHLRTCSACERHGQQLEASVAALADLPRLTPDESIAARVLDRLEVESRGPGLALLFRPSWAARPLMLPSLVPAVLLLAAVLGTALYLLQYEPLELPRVASAPGQHNANPRGAGTEFDPLVPSTAVSTPRLRADAGLPDDLLAQLSEDDVFCATVVARDGSVSDVTLLAGDERASGPLLAALRRERFEPGRLRGQPVAVSIYRLISRLEVRASLT